MFATYHRKEGEKPLALAKEMVKFMTNKELLEAVQHYLHDEENTSEVAQKYGWPLGNWDVSLMTDFSFFCADKHFKEDISSWNVSSGIYFTSMFEHAGSFDQDLR